MARARRARIDFMDTMKTIGIVLVVAGHAAAMPEAGVTTLYAFHIPLFFWVSILNAATARGGRA